MLTLKLYLFVALDFNVAGKFMYIWPELIRDITM